MKYTLGVFTAFLLLVVVALPASADGITTAERYAGSFIRETTNGNQYFWYVDSESGERYALNTARDFSRLLTNVGKKITERELSNIPASDEEKVGISDAAIESKGAILLLNDNVEQAWYVDPLTLRRYRIRNGAAGFEVSQGLALGIPAQQLIDIPVTQKLGFNALLYYSTPIILGSNLDFETYQLTFDYLRNKHLYNDRFTDEDLYFGSLKGMINATGDKNTAFLTPEENDVQRESFFGDSSIDGIGAVIQSRNDSIYIVQVLQGTPAERAGLQGQDQILAIDGVSTAGMEVADAVAKIRGVIDTYVRLTIYRANSGIELSVDVQRAHIVVPSIESKSLDNGKTAYFRFTLFTSGLLRDFYDEMNKTITPATQGIILDLRDNIGGVTSSAAQIVDLWLGEGQPVYIEKRLNSTIEYVANEGRDVPHVPTYILVNEGTASAAEIVTAALKHYQEATVIGTTTYGKGTGQDILNFADGSGLRFTTFEWLTPSGASINGKGIAPDVVLELQSGSDNQLQFARNLIVNQ